MSEVVYNTIKDSVTREMVFTVDYVSCLHCGACYGQPVDGKRNPVFCQIHSFDVDPTEIEKNEKRARLCEHWTPEGADRSKIIVPPHECWYEKDSMG